MKTLTTIFIVLLSSFIATAQTRNEVLIKNATVLTAIHGTLENTDILIRDGKIAKIGKGLTAGSSAKVIDATGKYVTPG
jgi:dihydroorotase-like cyclic amidohydrolase